MLFLEYPKCSTCKKAKKWLDEQGISYEDRHIIEDNPTVEELKDWHERSGLLVPLMRPSYSVCTSSTFTPFR